ncbi:hypothetical protein H6501_02660 [Candidatus Woesearchaeota archaeon]|nr:hypothetical protein [Nanoarchaeota archaeon]MCB9370472.1 hypothetical protein [Candidatus Woesearchaeota archaeon]USN43551.1 MAG: hypothetical protein H6500_04105 [Candidatus Woesearchaeota archaeon]
MEVIRTNNVVIEEVIEEIPVQEENFELEKDSSLESIETSGKGKLQTKEVPATLESEKFDRPEAVEAKVYKLRSRFVNENLYITLSYVKNTSGKNRPIEIFINSKDLSKLPEYTVLTRLISAIFRHFKDPKFILEELQSIYDPGGGYFLKGKYIYSFYSEVAMIIEKFFVDIGFIAGREEALDNWIESAKKANPQTTFEVNNFKICPQCNQKSLQVDGGCLLCINPECGYSKCS